MNAKGSLYSVAFAVFAISTALPQGQIVFGNRNIPTAGRTGGGNGNGTYNVPIWQCCASPPQGAGSFPGGITVALFTLDGALIGSTVLRTDANSQFFATCCQTVTVPGSDAGTTPTLLVRAWSTSAGSFQNAKVSPGAVWGEWSFTTEPLGGTPVGGGATFPIPNMTGWGPESGAGYSIPPIDPPPVTVQVTLHPGFNLVGNPLSTADSRVRTLFENISGGIPGGTAIYFLETNGQFSVTTWDDLDNRFVPFDVASRTLLPGDGVFLFLPSATDRTLSVTGQAPFQVCTTLPHGFSIKAGLGSPTYTINLSPQGGDTVYLYNSATKNYDAFMYDDLDSRWAPDLPHPNAGQAFLFYRAGAATTWCRSYNSP